MHSVVSDNSTFYPVALLPSFLLLSSLIYNQQHYLSYSFALSTGVSMPDGASEVLLGSLDLMVLQTLESMGPLHGYGIARRIEHISEDVLHLNQGTIYVSLVRLQQKGWISASWGASENNRKAKFYAITRS